MSIRDKPDEGMTVTEVRRFAALCPTCGDLDVSAEQMWLVLTDCPGKDHYFFHCPGCDQNVRRRAHSITVRLLEKLIPVEHIQIPSEALESHEGEPLTMDDLIDLMLALEHTPSPRPDNPRPPLRVLIP